MLELHPLQNVLSILVHIVAADEVANEEARDAHHRVVNDIVRKLVLSRSVLLVACRPDSDAPKFKRNVAHHQGAPDSKGFVEVSRHFNIVLLKLGDRLESV